MQPFRKGNLKFLAAPTKNLGTVNYVSKQSRIRKIYKNELARRNEVTHKVKHAEEPFSGKLRACSIFLYQYPDL